MTADVYAFEDIVVNERTAKPRDSGITIIVDWGLPNRLQADTLAISGPFIDLAKVAVGISALIPREELHTKIDTYRTFGIEPFPGGQFLEYAYAHDQVDAYLSGCQKVGYRTIEVSDNIIPINGLEKAALVRRAQDCGLTVIGEAGSKRTASSAAALIADAQRCLATGCWKVLIEAAELFVDGRLRVDLLKQIDAELRTEDIVWELPGPWIRGISESDARQLEVFLIENLGPNTNIANVHDQHVPALEALRRGLGVHMLTRELQAATLSQTERSGDDGS